MRLLSFLYLVPLVDKFVFDKCDQYRIDYSHDLHHSHMVHELGSLIADRDYYFSKKQREMLYLSCMLHDMCNPDYTPRTQSILEISNFLQKKCGVSAVVHDAVTSIITTMSYHDYEDQLPPWFLKEKDVRDVYRVANEANLLTCYNLKRLIHYKREKEGLIYSSDIYHGLHETIDTRISKMLEKDLFQSPTAKKIAEKWHCELCEEVFPRLAQDDIYPILNKKHEPVCTGFLKNW